MPTPTQTPVPTSAPPSPAALPTVAAATAPAPTPVAASNDGAGVAPWMLGLGGAVAVLAVAGVAVMRRRRSRADAFVETEEASVGVEAPLPPLRPEPVLRPASAGAVTQAAIEPSPISPSPDGLSPETAMANPVRSIPAPPALAQRARLDIELNPLRAGVNLLTATLDVELVIRNVGDGVAEDVVAGVTLLSAETGQEATLARLFAEPVARPLAPAFALGPGETKRMKALVTLARSAINVLTAAGRPMYVPVAAANVLYTRDGEQGQTAAAFAIGIERDGSDKLGPFWLDVPGQMAERVAARPHALRIER